MPGRKRTSLSRPSGRSRVNRNRNRSSIAGRRRASMPVNTRPASVQRRHNYRIPHRRIRLSGPLGLGCAIVTALVILGALAAVFFLVVTR